MSGKNLRLQSCKQIYQTLPTNLGLHSNSKLYDYWLSDIAVFIHYFFLKGLYYIHVNMKKIERSNLLAMGASIESSPVWDIFCIIDEVRILQRARSRDQN